MDGFKSLPKMQCFKEGGSVKNKMPAFLKKETKSEVKMDKAQDKSMVKKGVKQHESALHKGEPKTELKLKTGGRAKKAAGTVKKFEKASGEYGAKKTAADKKNIKEAKQFKPAFKDGGEACAPSAAKKAKNTPAKMCGGKSVKKYQEGKSVKGQGAVSDTEKATAKSAAVNDNDRMAARAANALKYLGPAQQSEFVKQGGMAPAPKKKGGKIKKYAAGGAVLSDEEKNWLGGADATDPYILARMRSAMADKKPAVKPQAAAAPSVQPAMDKPYQAPNVEQDSGLAYPQENEMRTAPMAPRPAPAPIATRPAARPVRSTDIARLNEMARGQGVFPEGSDALTRPYVAPNVEQDSGLEYPIKPGFFNATPGQQAAQFNRGAEQRKNVGRKIGNFLGFNKKPVS